MSFITEDATNGRYEQLPSEIDFFGEKWRVRVCTRRTIWLHVRVKNAIGGINRNTKTIYVWDKSNITEQWQTLIHELIHLVVGRVYGSYEDNSEAEERLATKLDVPLYEVLNANFGIGPVTDPAKEE